MNHIWLFMASGDSLYAGAGLLLLAVATARQLKQRWLAVLRRVTIFVALTMTVMASPPFSWLVDGMFLAAFSVWVVTSTPSIAGWKPAKMHLAAAAVLIILLVVLPAVELLHRAMPVVTGERGDHIAVIGDSISSGLDPRVVSWPVVLQRNTGAAVKNLALPGALTAEERTMAQKVAPEDSIVVIEIGGNDLLEGTPSNAFEVNLEALLAQISKPGRTVVMFELPLLPHRIAYGRFQRRLAVKHHVFLIPKHFFTDVLSAPGATLDGLHLSDVGAHRMADLVARVLAPVLKTNPAEKHAS